MNFFYYLNTFHFTYIQRVDGSAFFFRYLNRCMYVKRKISRKWKMFRKCIVVIAYIKTVFYYVISQTAFTVIRDMCVT